MNRSNAEIITIGDEILYGQILDTNTQWISIELDKIGISIIQKTSVGDNKADILRAFAEAESRADVILVTGGLGPTNDDITKSCFCEYFACGEAIDEDALVAVTDFFAKRGRELTSVNRLQASLPTACKAIANNNGTAPGMWFDRNGKVFISMPGVPHEMRGMMTESVIPELLRRFDLPVIYHQWIKTVGIGESVIADLIKEIEDELPENIKLAYLPSLGEVRLRLSCRGATLASLQEQAATWASKIVSLIPDHVYATNDITLMQSIAQVLVATNLTIASAESCTGGYIAHQMTQLAGSSRYYKGSVVSYDNEVKINVLSVPQSILDSQGAVSEEVVKIMAENVRKIMGTSIGVSASGIAGPDGGSEHKPVGLVWIAFSDGHKTVTKKLTLGNNRENNIKLTCVHVLNLIRKNL